MKKLFTKLSLVMTFAILVGTSCNSPKPTETIENLKAAITGETGANAKYKAFAEKATEEGHLNIAKMFEAASSAEAVHIKNHNAVLTKLGEAAYEVTPESATIGSTAENIKSAVDGETYEFTTMYPGFVEKAKEQKSQDAVTSFTWAQDAEKRHAKLYSESLSKLTADGNDSQVSATWYVCPKCGDLYNSIDGVDNCELCGTKSSSFMKF